MKTKYRILNDCRGMDEDKIIDRVLKTRGVKDKQHFLNPQTVDLLPLDALHNIGKAADIVVNSIKQKKRIGVFYDVDTDGITAGTIMTKYLQNFLKEEYIYWYINQGKEHGLVNADVNNLMDVETLIIVDSLDNTIECYKYLAEQGIDVIILDHHEINPNIEYNQYTTLVSSQYDYDNPYLSGAGVVWKFCKYLDKVLNNNYADELADLAACGLVADMMNVSELSTENRYIIYEGLSHLHNYTIKKIIGGFPFNSTAIVFSIAPLINAANRMNHNDDAVNAFLSTDEREIRKYIKKLKEIKDEQNIYIKDIYPQLLPQVEKQKEGKLIHVLMPSQSNRGLSGLLANKLMAVYQRPVLVLQEIDIDGESYLCGSGRGVGVNDFRKICNDTGFAKADGHKSAFGIQIKTSEYLKFISCISDTLSNVNFENIIDIDIHIDTTDITKSFVEKIKELEYISGDGFKPIKVLVTGITEYDIGHMSGKKHFVLYHNDIQFIKWNFAGKFEEMEENSLFSIPLSAIGTLDSGWLGRKFSLKVICDEIREMQEGEFIDG